MHVQRRLAFARDNREGECQRGMRHVGAANVERPGDVLRIRHYQRVGAKCFQFGLNALELIGGALAGEFEVAHGDCTAGRYRPVGPQRVDWIAIDRH